MRKHPSEEVAEFEREQAEIEAERLEVYEGGPLPDANFFDHDPFCCDGEG